MKLILLSLATILGIGVISGCSTNKVVTKNECSFVCRNENKVYVGREYDACLCELKEKDKPLKKK